MSNYKLILKVINLDDYKINKTKSLDSGNINLDSINNNNLSNINNNYNLYINYNQYPYYDIDKLENNINTFSNKENIKNPFKDIFLSDISIADYSILTNLNKFNKFLEDKYDTTKNDSYNTNEKIALMKQKLISDIKKYVEKDNNNIDITKYITFYNIDYLLKNYIFTNNSKIKLEKENGQLKDFLIKGYEYIIPRSNNNTNYIINNTNNTITIKLKLTLKEQKITNQLVVKFLLRGDLSTLHQDKEQRKKKI